MSASMLRPSRSIVAPLFVGLRADDGNTAILRSAMRCAVASVPPFRPAAARPDSPVRAVMLEIPRTRFVAVARLTDFGDHRPAGAVGHWRWIVAVRPTGPDAVARTDRTFDGCATVYRIEVLAYRLRAGAVEDAAPLALLRHLLVAGLRASTPHPVVAGGQHDWHDAWWTQHP